MATSVAETRERVQSYLTSIFGRVEVDAGGLFTFQSGSTRVFVGVVPHPSNLATVVRVFAIMVSGAKLSPELYEYVARGTDRWVFGHVVVHLDDEGTGRIVFITSLLGDFLDQQELTYAVAAVAQAADEMDDELVALFGGTVFHP